MKNFYVLLFTTASLILGTNWTAYTQPPPPGGIPDSCAIAETITCGSVVSGSTATATNIDAPAFCGTDLSTAPGVWYTFTGDGSSVTLTTCSPNTDYDTKLGIFEGPCAALTCIGGDDDDPNCANSGLQSTPPAFTTTLGTEYYVYVTGFGTNTGNYELTMSCSAPCAITGIQAGAQTPCDGNDNTYTQEVTVTYSDAPETGTLDVNGQSFTITASPQTVTLVGLFSDGAPVDVTASSSHDPGCTLTSTSTFTAPTNCTATCSASFSGFTGQFYCVDGTPATLIPDPYGGTFSGPGISDDGGPTSWSPAGLPAAIPDNSTSGLDADIVVSGLNADDILGSICLEVQHTWVGDLTINLTNPQGTTVTLMNRPGSTGGVGFGCSSNDLLVSIVSGTGNDMEDSCAVGATYAIQGTFTAHDGADITSLNAGDPNGTWVVSVIDSAGGDTGELIDFTLNFSGNGTWDPAAAGPGQAEVIYTLTTCEGCVAADTLSPTVLAPDATFSYSANGLDVTFTYQGGVQSLFNWNFGDGNTSNVENPTHTYAAGGTYSVTLITTDPLGLCADTMVVSVTVSGCQVPTPIIDPSGPIDLCPGDSVVLTATNLPAGSGPTIPGSLTTTYAAGNGFDGNMFDVIPAVNMVVDDFDVHTEDPGLSDVVEVYYKVGTHVGSETAPGDWTLIASAPITSNGNGVPTNLGLALGLNLTAGQTYAFYLTTSQGNVDFDYTNGSSVGAVFVSNADVSILEGTGKEYPFAGSYTPRVWNGTLYYSIPGNSDYSLLWSPTGDTTVTTVAYGGTYTVTVDSAGCTATSAPVVVNTLSGPTAAFTSAALGLSVSFTDLSAGNIVSWDWDFADGNTSTLQNPTNNYTISGSYDVTLIVVDADGCSDTITNTIIVSSGCNINSVAAGTQTPCDPVDNSYTQEVVITYSNSPATGTLDVNGQSFAITTSPQTVVLVGLNSDGLPVDVTASFSDDPACTATEVALFTAPAACFDACPGNVTLLFENFNNCAAPAGWTNNIVTGDDAWLFGDNGGSNLDGSCMAYFDDDALGSGANDSWVELITPAVDNSSGDNLQLTFDFNYNHLSTDSFYVDVWNGASWDNVLLLTSDSTGTWNGGPYGFADIPLGGYNNADFQVRFVYNDGGAWAWYVGIDNVAICQIPAGACEITAATAGTQTPCDPATSTYDQDVIIEYTGEPGTGDIIVNGQAFPITGSPQTVTFTGLPADGLPMDVDVEFSDDPFCVASFTEVWFAPQDCYDPCPGATTLLWENFDGCAEPAGWTNNIVAGDNPWLFGDNGGSNLDGSCMAFFDDDALGSGALPSIVELLTPTVDNTAGDSLHLSFDFNYNHLTTDSFYVDVWDGTMWNNVLSLTSDSTGTWNGGPYGNAQIPLVGYNSADVQVRFGYDDGGAWAWYVGIDNVAICAFPIATSCDITSVTAGAQTPCDINDNTYTQEIVVEYADAPTTGTLDVNGQSFAITSSPQTVVLTGLNSDGADVDVIAVFSDDAGCNDTTIALFTAPEACTIITCPGGTTLIFEDFNGCAMPSDWTTNLVNGVDDWQFGDNGGDNLDGTCMAYFDDDIIGSGASPNWVQLFSPVVDASSGDNLQLTFDFNYNNLTTDSFYVDVWNGATWDNILLLTSDSTGAWLGGPYPTAVIPMAGYTNADFQVRFSFNDNGTWAWYVGIDNVVLCSLPVGACDITAATAGTQSPCDPATSTYDQDVIIEYNDAPATGDMIVNGQTFPITGSPQTVTFTGLPADGLPMDVSVSFTDDPFCEADFTAVWTAPQDCYDPCPGNTTLLWENFNGCALPAGWISNTLTGNDPWLFGDNGGANLDGSCMAYFDDDDIGSGALPSWVELITPPVDNSSGDNLQLTFDFNYNNLTTDSFYVDVWNGTTWDNVLLLTSDSTGTWNGGPYGFADIALSGYTNADFQVRFTYNDGGVWAWYAGIDNVAICQIPAGSCEITNITAGTQTPCDPATSTYDQDVIIEYTSAPATGDLIVNGQTFPITGSPQTVTFTGLPADGLAVDVDAEFSDDAFCTASFTAVWTAPQDCYDPCVGGTSLIWETFNDCMMPAGWSNNILTGDTAWLFGANGGNNLDGSCMAYFDDDDIGSGALPSWVELVTNPVDASSGDDMQLSFDFNYNHIGADSFYVDVWDGAQWDNVLLITSDSIGSWFQGPPYAQAVIPLSGYTNADFQVRFVYNDGGVWAWYVGIDNVALCAFPPTGCDITSAIAGNQTPCDPATSLYDQEVIIEYTSAPATGDLIVNGQTFPITGSPQTVTFTGLLANGLTNDVSVGFTDNPFCSADFVDVWTAPSDCFDPCPGQTTLLWESFNSCLLPAGWGNNILTGSDPWLFGDNGGDNIDGTCMAYFDDDAIGSGALPSFVELTTPVIDASSGANMVLEFDFNYNHIGADSFYVDVWDGAQWDNVLLITEDSLGFWGTPPYAHALIPLVGYSNADFQVRFVYNDGGVWAWYLGIDNVSICEVPPTACSIDDIVADAQGPCDPVTNEYTQDLIVSYSSNPATGTLDVNGQSFAITGSPQTVTLTGLDSDGQPVDVSANFSDDIFCTLSIDELFTAPVTCLPIPINDTCDNAIPIDCGQSIIDSTIYASTYEAPAFCGTALNTSPGMWYSFIGTGDQISITTCSPITNFDTKLGLFEGPCDSLVCIDGNDDDFTCPNSGLQSSINNFITTPGVEYLIYVTGFGGGTGVFELTLTCAPPCEISNVTIGAQTPCDPATNTYTQEVTVEYANPPATGFLEINGQQFAITTSPQTESLVGLLPNGQPVDLLVEFSDNTNCFWSMTEAWVAPEDCTPPPCTDPNAETIFSEDFNDCIEPAGWENNIITGDTAWLFVDQSPDAFNVGNIDGTCMALFDDDWLGSGAPASHVELVSPQIDLSNYTDVNFAFDFNFNDFLGETFYVDAWDGTTWNNLMTITGDSIGAWALGPPYPTATFSMAGYTNSDFQFRFGYNDNDNWGWYVGIDNIIVCGTPNCPPMDITLSGTEYCVGEDSTLVSVLEPYADYSWTGGLSGQSQWLTAGTYQVTVTDANGCTDSTLFAVTQIDNPLPPVITITGDTVFCEGGSVLLSGPAGMNGYQWNTGSTTPDITVFDSGTYTLYVIDSTGCESATSSVNVTVNPLPLASFSYTLVDFTINLTNLSLGADNYDWSFGDSNTSTVESPSHTYSLGGVYTITLVASNDCGADTANVTLGVMNIGVEEASGITEFSMYPNPVQDKLIMDLTLIENREMNIEFFDGLGQVVMAQQSALTAGANKLEFDLGHLAKGVYSIKIGDEEFTQVVRLVKR